IRANDVRFKITNERTASLAWGIFYRVAKHEMADIYKETLGRKGGGHLNKKDIQAGYTNMYPNDVDELFANKIGGKYNIINDGLWMWFLGSYCFGNSTRYNKNILEGRLRWFFGEEGRQYGLSAEFRSSAKVPEFTVKPSYVVEAQARKAGIKNVLPATGTDGQPAVTIEHPIPHFVAENDAKALKGLTIFRPEEILPASALKTSEKKSSIGRSHSPGKNPFDAFTKVIARSEVLRKGSFTLKQYAAEHSWIQKRYGDIEPLVQNWEATVIGDLYGEGLKDQPSLEHLDLIKRLEDKTDKGEVRLELTTNGNNLLRANKRESIEELFKVLCDPEIQEFGRNISILYEGGGKVAIRIKRFTQLLGKSTDSIRYVDIVITKNFPSIYSGSVKWYHDRGSFGLSYLEPDALSLLGELKRDQRRWDEWLKEARADNVAAKDKLSTAPPEIAVRPASIHQGGDLSVDQVRAFVLKPGRTAEEIIDLLQTNKAFEQADLVKQILTDAGTEYAATLAEYNRLLEHEKSMFAIASMAGFGVPGSFYSRIDIRREWWGRQLVSKWWEMEVYRFAVSSLWRPPIVKWSQDQGEMFAVTFRPQGTYTDLENFHDITEFEFSPNKFLVPMTIEVPGRALVGVDFSQAQESGRTTWVVEASYFGALIKGMVDLEIIKAKDAEAVAKAGIIEVQQEVGMYYNETMTVRLISSDHPDGKLILDGKKLAAQTVSVNADSEVEATIRKLKTAVRNKHWIITRFLARKLISLTGREAIMTIVEVIKIADQKKSSRTTRLLTEELVSLAVKGGMPTIEEAVNVARRYEARDVVVALNEKLDELKRTVAIQTAPAGLTALTTLKIVANTVDVSILTDDVLGNIVGVLMGKTLFAANLLSIFSSNMGRFGDISRGPSSQNISTDKVRVAQGNLYLEMNAEQFLVFLKEARQREPSRIIDVMKLHTGLFKEGSVVDRH
ncbi:MAG: hypothetical protein NTZ95_04545, partial [Candidatus Omnitrophica bacterium]|nr:hypothetical protein [Candidatus Omnitrophota bacterium]